MAKAKKAARKPAKSTKRAAKKAPASKKASVMKKHASGGVTLAQFKSLKGEVSKLSERVTNVAKESKATNSYVKKIDDAAGQGFTVLNNRLSNVERRVSDLDRSVDAVLGFSGFKGSTGSRKGKSQIELDDDEAVHSFDNAPRRTRQGAGGGANIAKFN